MNKIPLEALAIQQMACGKHSLALTEKIGWENFPEFAESLLTLIGGEVTGKTDAPDIRIWTTTICGHPMNLVYDDYSCGITIEPTAGDKNDQDDIIIQSLFQKLTSLRYGS